jgi:hypothetical protein
LLSQEVGDVIGPEGTRRESLLESIGHGFGAVLPDELEKFSNLAGERAVGVGQAPQEGFDGFNRADAPEQGDQPLLSLRALSCGTMSEQFFFEALCAESLAPLPATRVTDDFPILVIERDRGRIGLDDQALTHEIGRGAVAVAIEVQAKILVDECFGGVAIIGSQSGEGPQAVRAEAVARSLACFAVEALVGDFI